MDRAFDVLIGTWKTEARHPMLDGFVYGSTTFEWLEDHDYLLMRSRVDDLNVPDGLFVIGPPEDGEGLQSEYFDSRGVRRTYEGALEDGVLRMWRDAPGFDQRMEMRLGEQPLEMLTELAREPGQWRADLEVTYRCADG